MEWTGYHLTWISECEVNRKTHFGILFEMVGNSFENLTHGHPALYLNMQRLTKSYMYKDIYFCIELYNCKLI